MHQPELYADVSRKVFQQRLDDVAKLVESLTWSSSSRGGRDSLKVLDVGCGPGDLTAQELLPRLWERRSCRLVGVDSEASMVSYASHNHARPGVLSFHQLDIAHPHLEATQLYQQMAPFHLIFSYYCLHWVTDQSQAVKNLFKLLSQEHGQLILVFVAKDGIAQAYRNLSRNHRWKPYLQDCEKYFWAYQDSADPAQDFRDLMERTGFTVETCVCETRLYDYKTEKVAKDLLGAISPFMKRLAAEERPEFLQDLFTECLESKFLTKGLHDDFIGSSEALIVKAHKLP